MTQLAVLRSRLNQLRRQRTLLRWVTAWSGVALAVLWTLLAAFALDWLFQMSRPQRVVLIALSVGVLAWAFRRYALPWLGHRESEVDMALMVERQQHIDSDLVAAIQFETPESRQWGSPQLEDAVIHYVADFSRDLRVWEGITHEPARNRARLLAGTLVAVFVLAVMFPAHWATFFNRLLLGAAHYPTRTTLHSLRVNDTDVDPANPGQTIVVGAFGQPLKFEIGALGEIPPQGRVVLSGVENGVRTEIPLTRANLTSPDFQGELPRLVDSVSYQVYLGDAWTDPGEIRLIPLPAVTVDLQPIPPKYAATALAKEAAEQLGARQIAVIEGSRVALSVTCTNKPLSSAVMTINEKPWPLESQDREGRVWTLAASDSPLNNITKAVRYEIQVEDEDGLKLDQPIQGYIRIKADRPPRVAAAMISRRVLPTAAPRISYGAADDYGLEKILVQLHIARLGGKTQTETVTLITVPTKEQPQTVLRGDYALDLSPFSLVKGDEIKVTLEAFDHRGENPSKSAVSEPLVLQVTDREGILAGLLEADEKSARQLDAIIRRELGIGDSK